MLDKISWYMNIFLGSLCVHKNYFIYYYYYCLSFSLDDKTRSVFTDHSDHHRLWRQDAKDVDWTDVVCRVRPAGYLLLRLACRKSERFGASFEVVHFCHCHLSDFAL